MKHGSYCVMTKKFSIVSKLVFTINYSKLEVHASISQLKGQSCEQRYNQKFKHHVCCAVLLALSYLVSYHYPFI